MPNNPLDTDLLDRAIIFATRAHAGTERRGKGFPYIVHPLEAMEIVSTITNDQELLAAAVLHDTVEDTDTTIGQIRVEFGDRVARLVAIESVPNLDTWRERKLFGASQLAASPIDSKIVAMGDKLSNMRAIARDYQRVGDKVWSLFKAPNGRSDVEWYYRQLATALADLDHTEAYQEFIRLVGQTFGPDDSAAPQC